MKSFTTRIAAISLVTLSAVAGAQIPAQTYLSGLIEHPGPLVIQDGILFNGNAFVTPTVLPVGTLVTTFYTGPNQTGQAFTYTFPANVYLQITNDFAESSTNVFDTNNSGTVNAGDSLITFLNSDGGAFRLATGPSASQTIVSGSFLSGTFQSQIGNDSGGLIALSGNALDINPGAGFVFPNGFTVTSLFQNFQLTMDLNNIASPGVTVSNPQQLSPGVFSANLNAFGLADIDTQIFTGGVQVVVPEPATLALLALSGLALTSRRRKA